MRGRAKEDSARGERFMKADYYSRLSGDKGATNGW